MWVNIIYVSVYIYIYIYMYIYIYIHILYICVYICVCVYIANILRKAISNEVFFSIRLEEFKMFDNIQLWQRCGKINSVMFLLQWPFHWGKLSLVCWIQKCLLYVCVSVQLYSTVWDPMDWGLPSSSVHAVIQARYWSGLLLPTPGDLPDPGINSCLLHCLHWQVDSLPLSHLGSPYLL